MNRTINSLLAPICLLFLVSCGGDTSTAEEKGVATEDTAASVAPALAFEPFDVALVTHKVKDYTTWRPEFDADSVNQKENGMKKLVVAKEVGNPSNVMMAFKVNDVQKAKAYVADPGLKKAMEKAG